MSNIDYKELYEELVFEKITLQKEYDKYKILQEQNINDLSKENDLKVFNFYHSCLTLLLQAIFSPRDIPTLLLLL